MSGVDRTEHLRGEASRVFDAAVRDVGVTNEAIGDASGVAESRVRRWRSDDKADLAAPPPTTVLLACSPELFEAWFARARAARIELHGAPPALSLRELLLRVLHADGALQQEIAAALERGVQPGAVPGLLSRVSTSEQARDALVFALRRELAR